MLNNYYIKRWLAFYIDGCIITIFTLIMLFLFDRENLSIDCDSIFCWNSKRIMSFQLLFYFVYFNLMEFFFLKTIGKILLKFYIHDRKSKRKFLRFFFRTILRLIPINIISFMLDKNHLFWHEKFTEIYTAPSIDQVKK